MKSIMETQIAGLQALSQQGTHQQVYDQVTAFLQSNPTHRDALLLQATALRHLKCTDESLTTLDILLQAHPQFSLAHQERGLCFVALKEADAAIAAFLKAVHINPALPMSWRMLEGVYKLIGDETNATLAAAHSATLAALPPPIVQATALFSDGEIKPAETLIRAFLLQHGDHPEAMRLLAKIALVYDALDDAEALLFGVVQLAPDHHAARQDYTDVLIKRQKYGAAFTQVSQLRAADSENLGVMSQEATALCGLGRHQEAIALYQAMIAQVPEDADVHLWQGHALKTIGQFEAAIEAYHAAIACRGDFGDAWWSLANLKTYQFTPEDICAMQKAEASAVVSETDRVHICFALGKAHEDARDYASAWQAYAQGNSMQRAASKYRPEILETNTRLQRAMCTQDFFQQRQGWGNSAPDPIFILGLPRAGSTLLEQILASHSQVEGTQELIDIQRMSIALQGRDPDLDNPRYPASLLDLSAEQVQAMGTRYLADTRMYRTGKSFFIDKMPNNFRHIGLIHLILPNAKIIDARREPMACCFSNFKQLFAQGQEFTYSLEDIGRYYRTYVELMEHWDAVLPGRVLRVQHEDVLEDLEGQVRRLLEYCSLPFEQSCVDFHTNRRSVRTPSAQQVRQPIYKSGMEQWTHFAEWLTPLETALGDTLSRYKA